MTLAGGPMTLAIRSAASARTIREMPDREMPDRDETLPAHVRAIVDEIET